MNSAGQIQTTYGYDPFGNTASSAGTSDPNPLRYTGLISGPVMPAGRQDNNARDYSYLGIALPRGGIKKLPGCTYALRG